MRGLFKHPLTGLGCEPVSLRKIEALSRQIEQTEQFKKDLLQKLFV